MVRDNDAGALELHVRVNGQNLLAIPEKCNASTLRLPSDPSWPKIPLRHLTGNTGDIIKPPCVVTVIGTHRRNHNIAQTITYQYPMTRINKKYETVTHVSERLPGCVDPRFKRQVSRQKAEKPGEFCNANQTQVHVSHECQSGDAKREETAGNIISTISVPTDSKMSTSKEFENGKVIQRHNTNNIISESKNCDDGCVSNLTRDKENINLNICEIPFGRNDHYKNFNRDYVGDARGCENSSNLNIAEKLGNSQIRKGDSKSNHTLQRRSHSALLERKVSSEKTGTAEISESHCSCDKMLQQCAQVTGKERQKSDESKAKLRREETRYNSNRKSANPTNLSRKAKSFLRRRSRLAATDSDCTLMLPGPRRIKRYERTRDPLRVSQLSRRRNWMNGTIRMRFNASRRGRMNRNRLLANLRADNPFEQPSPIPPETQELLNKSYWEYYRKLRRKVTSARPDTAREEDNRESRSRASLPASRTLQQCSVFSCMINDTL